MVEFNHPSLIAVATAFVSVFLTLSVLIRRSQSRNLALYGQRATLGRFSVFTRKHLNVLVSALVLTLLGLSIADPVAPGYGNSDKTTLNAIFVVDVSKSMFAEDGLNGTSRLQTTITVIEKVLDAYPNGRFGLVIYTSTTASYPPTYDHQALKIILRQNLVKTSLEGKGSSPLLALNEAAKLVAASPLQVNTVFLLSDGGQSTTTGLSLKAVAGNLKDLDLNLIAVGIGDLVSVPIPVYKDGELLGYHQLQNRTAYTSLDEQVLDHLAEATDGSYFRLTSFSDLLNVVRSRNLDRSPTNEAKNESLIWLPVSIAVLIVITWLLVSRFK